MNAELLDKLEATPMLWSDYDGIEEMFDNELDADETINIIGMNIYPSEILRRWDFTAYQESLATYADGLDKDGPPPAYLCPICNLEHVEEQEAIDCCQPDQWQCYNCEKIYSDEEQAESCCSHASIK